MMSYRSSGDFYFCSIRAKVQVPHVELLYCCKIHNLVIHGFSIKFIHLLAGFYPDLYVWKSLTLKLPQPEAVLSTALFIPAISKGGIICSSA